MSSLNTSPENPSQETLPVGAARVLPTARPFTHRLSWHSPVVIPLALLAIATLLWLAALPNIAPYQMTDIGLVSVLPASFLLALAVTILGFCAAVFSNRAPGWAPGAFIALWIVMIHATPTIVFAALRYAWAWKHVGIVDYIQRTGTVDPAISIMPVYHNWPGFFGTATLLTQVAGFANALPIAIWATLFFELAFASALFLVMRAATADLRVIWLTVWFFTLTNWVGQDYFAPQAIAFFFYLVVIAIALWAFPAIGPLADSPIGRVLVHGRPLRRLAAWLDQRIGHADAEGIDLPPATVPQQRGLLLVAVLLMAGIAVTHQLTPGLAFIALAALVLFGRCRAYGLPVLMAIFTATWLVTGAGEFAAIGLKQILDSLGQTNENINANLIDASLFTPGFRIISNMARGLTAAVGLLAALGWLWQLRQGKLNLSLTLLWLAPLGLLAVSSYGGEILFRVYFFALPFMAFYVAALFVPARGVWRAVAAGIVSAALAVAMLFAYYGHDRANFFPPGEQAASDYLTSIAPTGSLIVEASPNYPSRYRRYDEFVYVPLIAWPRGNVEASMNAYSLEDIETMMASRAYPATYLIFTKRQLEELSIPGLESIEAIQRDIAASGRFDLIFRNSDASIYILANGPQAEGTP